MPTTTPSFNWPVPLSSDLVKDGATAIESLGDAIDASMTDLKGGTTGQVLAKASNTNMDFTWVAQDDSNAIQNAIVDAKGDLIAATANDTPARLAVGNNGETLVADSSTSTGLRYTAGTVSPNPVLNSSYQIWQRGTSVAIPASNNGYTADRWYLVTGPSSAMTVSRQATGDTTNLPNIQYCARVQRNSGQTGGGGTFANSFETINSIPFAGRTVTFSFYARAGANFSPTSSVLSASFNMGTGTDQNIGASYTGNSQIVAVNATLTTTWQRFSATATVPTTANEIAVFFSPTFTGTAGANDFYEVTGVQLDIGNVALPFRTNGETIQGELAACQRYYFRNTAESTNNYLAFGVTATTTTGQYMYPFPVTMRVAPSALEYANCAITDTVTQTSITNLVVNWTSKNYINIYTTGSTGLTAFRPSMISGNGTAGAYIGFSAEL